jgi:hypothetical protein
MSEHDDARDFGPFERLVPPRATPMYGFLVVVYMDDHGGICDDYQVVGDATLRDSLGTLDSVKFRMACTQFGVVRDEEPI